MRRPELEKKFRAIVVDDPRTRSRSQHSANTAKIVGSLRGYLAAKGGTAIVKDLKKIVGGAGRSSSRRAKGKNFPELVKGGEDAGSMGEEGTTPSSGKRGKREKGRNYCVRHRLSPQLTMKKGNTGKSRKNHPKDLLGHRSKNCHQTGSNLSQICTLQANSWN